ncbi:PAS domain S-box protein [Cytophagaceae bacterium DM2B3-1]|uniref:histidine kinase n=1 Tax=Xanthocytophaga flava TaxID=3048013 RepID=A0ABT7CKC0_9BACT|nr:PAS domain S-box protein [Xanthocytophaga flavus]MDJ1493971.1 PAS domain S-box protein [Xanthocytophaga flavus]
MDRSKLPGYEDLSNWLEKMYVFLSGLQNIDKNVNGLERINLVLSLIKESATADSLVLVKAADSLTAQIILAQPPIEKTYSFRSQIYKSLLGSNESEPLLVEDPTLLKSLESITGADIQFIVLIPVHRSHFDGVVMLTWKSMVHVDDFFRLFLNCCQVHLCEILEAFYQKRSFEGQLTQFYQLTRHMSQGCLFINDNSPTTYVNEAASKWLDITPGEHPAEQVSNCMYKLRMKAVNQDEISGQAVKVFSQSVIKDWFWKYDSPVSLVLKVSCIPMNGDLLNGKLWLFDDLTPEIQLQEQLHILNQSLTISNEKLAAQNRFVELINITIPHKVAVIDIKTLGTIYSNRPVDVPVTADILPSDEYAQYTRYFYDFVTAKDHEVRILHYRIIQEDNQYAFMRMNGVVFQRGQDDIPEKVLVIVEDITQLKKTELELMETVASLKQHQKELSVLNEEMLTTNEKLHTSHIHLLEQKTFVEQIISTTPSTIYILDLASRQTIYMSREDMAEFMVELYPDPKRSDFVIHPDDFHEYLKFFEECQHALDNEICKTEVRIKYHKGTYHYLLIRQTVFRRSVDGMPDQFIGTTQDITYLKDTENTLQDAIYALEAKHSEMETLNEELIAANEELTSTNEELLILTEQMKSATLEIQRLAAEKLELSEQKYMDLTENMREIFVVFDQELRYVYVNKAAELNAGLDRKYILGKKSHELFDDEMSQAIEFHVQKVIDTGTSSNSTTTFQYKSQWVYLVINLYPTTTKGAFAIIQNVTEEVMAEFRFKDLAESITEPIVMLDQDFRYIYWNKATERSTGKLLKNILGKTPLEALGEEYYNQYRDRFDTYQRVMKTGIQEVVSTTVIRDERLTYLEIAVYPTQQKGVLAITRNITARIEAEKNYHELGESITDSILLLDKELRYQYMNAIAEEYAGFRLAEVKGRTLEDVLQGQLSSDHLEIAKDRVNVYKQVMETGVSTELDDVEYYRNEERRVHIYVYPSIRGGVLVISRDVSKLYQAEQNYRDLADSITDIFFSLDKDLRYTYYNRASEKFTGRSSEQVIGKNVYDILTGLKGSPIEEKILEALNTKSPQIFTNEIWHQGQHYYHRMYFYPTRSGVSVLARDITERMQLTKKLEEDKQQLELALRSGELGLWDWNIETGDIDYNDQWLEILGYKRGELVQRIESWIDLIHPEDLESVTDIMNRHLKNRTSYYQAELRLLTKSGTWKWIYDMGKVIVRDENGKPIRATGIIMDITQKKQYELKIEQLNEELEQKVKERTVQLIAANKELEAFSYSVSHDLRIPLRSIDGFSRALQEDYAEKLDSEGVEYLNTIRSATQKMGQLIEDLMKLAKVTKSEVNKETVDLSTIAYSIVKDLQKESPRRKVVTHISDDLIVMGDEKLLGIALQNLLSNAWKYTGKREETVIELGKITESETPIYYIKDNGVGFDMKYADKLFQPFQRLHSKRDFEGTGVGLATVQRIIAKHGGHIWTEAVPDKGATFFFTLWEIF